MQSKRPSSLATVLLALWFVLVGSTPITLNQCPMHGVAGPGAGQHVQSGVTASATHAHAGHGAAAQAAHGEPAKPDHCNGHHGDPTRPSGSRTGCSMTGWDVAVAVASVPTAGTAAIVWPGATAPAAMPAQGYASAGVVLPPPTGPPAASAERL
jgi:hypothetical protein